jgi:hypothetical protein
VFSAVAELSAELSKRRAWLTNCSRPTKTHRSPETHSDWRLFRCLRVLGCKPSCRAHHRRLLKQLRVRFESGDVLVALSQGPVAKDKMQRWAAVRKRAHRHAMFA